MKFNESAFWGELRSLVHNHAPITDRIHDIAYTLMYIQQHKEDLVYLVWSYIDATEQNEDNKILWNWIKAACDVLPERIRGADPDYPMELPLWIGQWFYAVTTNPKRFPAGMNLCWGNAGYQTLKGGACLRGVCRDTHSWAMVDVHPKRGERYFETQAQVLVVGEERSRYVPIPKPTMLGS